LPSKRYLTSYGVIDIETFAESDIVRPYAVGIYHNNSFKSFYVTDFTDEFHMFLAVFYLLDSRGILCLWAHNGGKFDFKLILRSISENIGKGK